MAVNGRKAVRLLALAVVLAAVPVVGVVAWKWRDGVAVERIEVLGHRHADPQAVRKLARVDTGMALYGIDPVLVADRVRRHPWVGAARVERLPTGVLRIRVEERTPVALALTDRGAPDFFLDSTGAIMPHTPAAVFDVPLIRGVSAEKRKGLAVQNPALRELARALAGLDPSAGAIVSDLEVRRGEVWLHTTPLDARGSIPVHLGRNGFAEKLDRLHAFWRQAVLPQPEQTFAWIDLRFNSQVVTQEQALTQEEAGGEPSASDSLKQQ